MRGVQITGGLGRITVEECFEEPRLEAGVVAVAEITEPRRNDLKSREELSPRIKPREANFSEDSMSSNDPSRGGTNACPSQC